MMTRQRSLTLEWSLLTSCVVLSLIATTASDVVRWGLCILALFVVLIAAVLQHRRHKRHPR
jgi:hypothetical protein